jgi:hypothetical protein
MGVLVGEWSPNKGYTVAVKKAFGFVRRLVGHCGKFGVSSDIDAMDHHFTIVDVTEAVAVDAESEGRHDGC